MQHGIIRSSFRALFLTFFGTLGLFAAFLFLGILFGLASSSESQEVEKKYSLEVAPNADGVRKNLSQSSPAILEIKIEGVIGTKLLNSDTVRQLLVESREGLLKKNRVKALLINLNTPGGTVSDADSIYRAILAYKKQYNVPVYAYVDGLLASGGMYIASACDKVYASNSSLIGSIGVIVPTFFNFSKLIDTLGLQTTTLYAGKGKDAGDPTRAWTPEEFNNLNDIVKFYYDQFVDIVTTARPKVNKEALVKEYGAAVFPAAKAEAIGLVDNGNASRDEALKDLLKTLSIEDDFYQVVQMKDEGWVSKIFNSQNPLFEGRIEHQLKIAETMDPSLEGKFLYLWRPGQ
ncbi:S49 family peptidase [Estrella lausannensis]|uniref:Putative signal peptide peptidase SppA n=1 Tax=Estrella lausannensis TaxID=483423 RepID=A0A0H5DRX5_9BACT|nr:S49 family peptidase [Estrella lausannensis]CRX38988.1 Putative signal peptide peptidase SppA [Estrella lausannensis]